MRSIVVTHSTMNSIPLVSAMAMKGLRVDHDLCSSVFLRELCVLSRGGVLDASL